MNDQFKENFHALLETVEHPNWLQDSWFEATLPSSIRFSTILEVGPAILKARLPWAC